MYELNEINEIVYEYFSNKNLFKRHKDVSHWHQTSNIFGPSAPNIRRFHVCPKNVWMWHCSWTDEEGTQRREDKYTLELWFTGKEFLTNTISY